MPAEYAGVGRVSCLLPRGFTACRPTLPLLLDRGRGCVQEEHAAAGQFGFPVDNTIGGTPQANGWMSDWVVFLRDRRLMPQLKMAGEAGSREA